ncbi:MAG: hypothetical protein ACK49N_08465 [Verrucomicrobiota bacterium]
MKLITIITIALATTLSVEAKKWRNVQGKSIEGEYVSRTDKDVTIRLTTKKTTTIPLDILHEDDRFWLDNNHPFNAKPAQNPAAVFDQLTFGDNRKQVEEKLKASKFAKLTVAETFIGRSGLNGVFRTTEKIGGLDASLFFEWKNEDSLQEVNLHTDSLPITQAQQTLIPCWKEFAKLLSNLYGKPVISSPELNTSSIPDGAYQPTHLWNLSPKGSVTLGASREGDKLLIVCRFSEKKTNPVALPE